MGLGFIGLGGFGVYSRSPKVGNPIASILKSHVQGIPALFDLNPVSNFTGFTVGLSGFSVLRLLSSLGLKK